MLSFYPNQSLGLTSYFEYNGWICISNAYNVTLMNNIYINTSVGNLGPLAIFSTNFVTDRNSLFENCAAVTGGAIYLIDVEIFIENGNFINNYA